MGVKSRIFMKHVLWIIVKTKPKKNDVELSNHSFQFVIQIFQICSVIGQKLLVVRQLVAEINIGKAVRQPCQENMENASVTKDMFCSMANVSQKMSAVVSCRAAWQFQMDGRNYQTTVKQNAFVEIMNINANQTIVTNHEMNVW